MDSNNGTIHVAIVEDAGPDTTVGVWFPDLPGCFSAGDDLAYRLAALYDYLCTRLLHANLNNDRGALYEVASLLTEIKTAWEEIADDPAVASRNKSAA